MTKRELLAKLRAVRTAERGIHPDPAWVLRTRGELLAKLETVEQTQPIVNRHVTDVRPWTQRYIPTSFSQLVRGPVVSVASVIGLVFGSSILSVSAADNSVPGDWLFPVKLATEQTRLVLTTDKSEKLKLKTDFVGRRVEEIKTIASSDVSKKEERMKEATDLLKRDLDTVNNQLHEVKTEQSPTEAAEAAKLLDQRSSEIASDLKEVKSSLPQELKSSMAQAEAALVNTGVKAVGVLIDVKRDGGEAGGLVTDEELILSITDKVQGLEATLADANQNLVGVATSGTTLSFGTASSTLQKAKTLLQENKFNEVAPQLIQAANAVAQAESDAVNQNGVTGSSSATSSASGAAPVSGASPATSTSLTATSTSSGAASTTQSVPGP
jgi:hypothetical protein